MVNLEVAFFKTDGANSAFPIKPSVQVLFERFRNHSTTMKPSNAYIIEVAKPVCGNSSTVCGSDREGLERNPGFANIACSTRWMVVAIFSHQVFSRYQSMLHYVIDDDLCTLVGNGLEDAENVFR